MNDSMPEKITFDPTNPFDRDRIAKLLDLDPIPKMERDVKAAALTLGKREVRFLVDAYYTMQKNRIRADHQTRKLAEFKKPNVVIDWLSQQDTKLETYIRGVLDKYSGSQQLGRWARSITGVGPVIAAGFLAGLDINEEEKDGSFTVRPTVGHFWRICGLHPGDKKVKGKKLVWDPTLKRLCWILGESFTKVSGRESDVYGKVYIERKAQEIRKNDNGDFAEQAQLALDTRDFTKDTVTKAWYLGCYAAGTTAQYYALEPEKRLAALAAMKGPPGSGVQMLPPARIQLRAQRYAVKLFLSHFHYVWHELEFKKPPPMPYVLTHLGHAHFIAPPNWPMKA